MTNFLLQEDGSSRFILEDGSGDLLLEFSDVNVPFIGSVSVVYAPDLTPHQVVVPFIASATSVFGALLGGDFPVTGIVDDFNRANENPLSGGGNWDSGTLSTVQELQLLSNAAAGTTSATSSSHWTPGVDDDQEAFCTITVLPDAGDGAAVGVRFSGTEDGLAGYAVRAEKGSPDVIKLYVLGGTVHSATLTQIGSTFTVPGGLSAGDKIGIRARGAIITAYYQPAGGSWVQVADATDTTWITGDLFLRIRGTTARLDDFGGGSVPLLVPFVGSQTVVYAPTLADVAGSEVDVPFIASKTHVWPLFSLFDPNRTYSGPGNGGEIFLIRLAPNGTTETATLAADISDADTTLELTGDGSFPSTVPFVVTIDDEVLYVVQVAPGSYRIRKRAMSNTAAASHTAGATVSWGDSYDMAIRAAADIGHSFTADINSTGSFTYPGWLICFDSSQAYLSSDRYPMHVTEVLGVFDAGAGSSGSSRLDGAQPNAISTPTGVSDDCPAALSNPARISSDITAGDVAVVRYTNPEASVLDLGPRAVSLESWFGLKRVSTADADVTFTDPNGIVIDTTGTYDTFTGSVNDEWGEPIPLLTGIAPDASDAAGVPVDTPNPVPWTTVTLPGTDRKFTYGSAGGGYDEKGWPICCLAVRQGNRRVPFWQSWDWHDYGYVYTGFGTDATFCQLLINRNGIVFGSVPAVDLPGPQDIDGPDVVWDDATYYVGASWYVAIFSTPYIVFGPTIGGSIPPGDTDPGGTGIVPGVTFPPSGGPVVIPPPPIEGGEGGDITPPGVSLFQAAVV